MLEADGQFPFSVLLTNQQPIPHRKRQQQKIVYAYVRVTFSDMQ
jgi:hypothetical protein